MRSAVLGFTGLVGSQISDANDDFAKINRENLDELFREEWGSLFISALPAEKWRANKFPDEDKANLDSLKHSLSRVAAQKVVLVSTVDVFGEPANVDENSFPVFSDASPYGQNRLDLELFVEAKFKESWIVRLPALVSKRLKKNLLFDIKHGRETKSVPINAEFQFYPLDRLVDDLRIVCSLSPGIYHLTSRPIEVMKLATEFNLEPKMFAPPTLRAPKYDLRTVHASNWGVSGHYQVEAQESLAKIYEYLNDSKT